MTTYIPGVLPPAERMLVERLHGDFLQALSEELSRHLLCSVAARLEKIEPAGESSPTELLHGCVVALEIESPRASVFSAFPAEWIARVLRILMLTPADAPAAEQHAVTEIELHLMRDVLELVGQKLAEAWRTCGFEARLVSMGPAPAVCGPMLLADALLSFDDVPERFRIGFPALLARIAAIHGNAAGPTRPARETILRNLGSAALRVEAILEGSALRIGDLLAVRPGQILAVGQPVDAACQCVINGKVSFAAIWSMWAGGRHSSLPRERGRRTRRSLAGR